LCFLRKDLLRTDYSKKCSGKYKSFINHML
jgi:hypothetical protein